MGFRESLDRNRRVVIPIGAAAIILAGGLLFWQSRASHEAEGFSGGSDFYTTDDGATWFTDSADKVPPFDVGGKPAYRAYLFSCDGGKTKWMGYLERYTPAAAKSLAAVSKPGAAEGPSLLMAPVKGIEVKRPGDAVWVDQTDLRRAQPILAPRCPHGGQHTPEPAYAD